MVTPAVVVSKTCSYLPEPYRETSVDVPRTLGGQHFPNSECPESNLFSGSYTTGALLGDAGGRYEIK